MVPRRSVLIHILPDAEAQLSNGVDSKCPQIITKCTVQKLHIFTGNLPFWAEKIYVSNLLAVYNVRFITRDFLLHASPKVFRPSFKCRISSFVISHAISSLHPDPPGGRCFRFNRLAVSLILQTCEDIFTSNCLKALN